MTDNLELPKKLFKYRPVNKFTASIIKDSEIYLSSPGSFNDPFDCRVAYSTECSLSNFHLAIEANHLGLLSKLKELFPSDRYNDDQFNHEVEYLLEHKDGLITANGKKRSMTS